MPFLGHGLCDLYMQHRLLPIPVEFIHLLGWAWVALEVAFFALVMLSWLPTINIRTKTPEYKMSPEELITKVLDMVKMVPGYDMETFISGWFLGAPFSEVKKDNLVEFICWAMYNKDFRHATPEESAAMGRKLAEFQQCFPRDFEEGYNPKVSCTKFTLEDAASHIIHRPLVFYVMVSVFRMLGSALLHLTGFMYYTEGEMAYWYRPSARPAGALEPLPLVFFHGISPGLMVYLAVIRHLVSGRSALLVDMRHVGMGLDMRPPSREQTLRDIRAAFRRHGFTRACVAGHSYGSVCAGWMAADTPELVAQLVLLDPVCLLLACPDVAYNFLYRKPKTLMEFLVHHAATEIGIANTLRRHFWWFNNCLWLEDIAKEVPVVVHLAENDEVVPVDLVRKYLEGVAADREGVVVEEVVANKDGRSSPRSVAPSHAIDVMWSKGYSHGQLLYSFNTQKELATRVFLQEARLAMQGDSDDEVVKKPSRAGDARR
mmetsp:Transcript_19379/g.44843  ORF Transcript_19379/g.44843 Transcript_19379/m.44843 type:complete len:487 (+) Transcript_19379:164-1624(+)